MPNTPEGFNAREKEAPRYVAKVSPEKSELNPIERARSMQEKTKALSKKQNNLVALSRVTEQKLSQDGQLPEDELRNKVEADMEKYADQGERMDETHIDLGARIDSPAQAFASISPYATSTETREAAPEASLRNLYDMMRTKPTILGMSSVSKFDNEIKLNESDKQIVLSPTVMMKLASLANKHGTDFLNLISRENKGKAAVLDASGFITADKAGVAMIQWKNLVDMISAATKKPTPKSRFGFNR